MNDPQRRLPTFWAGKESRDRKPATSAMDAWLPALAILILLAAGCTRPDVRDVVGASVVEILGASAEPNFARVQAPRDFEFPRDHGPHPEYRIEWWYYTGNLEGEDGRPYGFQLTFFRTALSAEAPARASHLASNQVYMAHFAVTDGGAGRHDSFDRLSRGAAGLAGAQGVPDFAVWLDDWSVQEVEPGLARLRAAAQGETGPVAIDLTLRQTRPPIYHGERGLSRKGPGAGNANYYYSLVNLEVAGRIATPAGANSVTGLGWMDHEFGTSSLSEGAVGWDWFSIQLDNGAIVMVYLYRFARAHTPAENDIDLFEGSLVYPDGRQITIRPQDFELAVTERWTSPKTGITYPTGWRLVFAHHELALDIRPLIQDQEMNLSFVYYEGAIQVEGEMAGQPVSGRGYVELTGYGEEAGEFQR